MPKLVDQGETWVLQQSLGSNALYIGLYKDTSEPAEDATLATITECSGAGYSRLEIAAGDWTISGDTAEASSKTWTAGEDWGDIYGYFICDVSSGTTGNLLFVEHFSDGPYTVKQNHKVTITPRVTAS